MAGDSIIAATIEGPSLAIRVIWEAEAVVGLHFVTRAMARKTSIASTRSATFPAEHRETLQRYLNGEPVALSAIPVRAAGTPFQQRVWNMLRQITRGSTWSYRELASALGMPNASRAVGSANGANPVPLIVPCHRVVRSDGTLGGYSGAGGMKTKELLLELERSRLPLAVNGALDCAS